jgi:hypothetical protein
MWRRRESAGEGPVERMADLGWLQFERLCAELLLAGGVGADRWRGRADGARTVLVSEGTKDPLCGEELAAPVLVHACWVRTRPTTATAHATVLTRAAAGVVVDERAAGTKLGSLLLLTNLDAAEVPGTVADLPARALGARELLAIVARDPGLRLRLPSLLGVCDLERLIEPRSGDRSSADVDAARALARVFVPTHAYAQTLEVLGRHRFAVLTGPPEMGKTAIARMVALAQLTAGWEAHECVRPDELWERFRRDRAQIFVADDAFGSTEYRPEAAERWALELDRVLNAMDDSHWLIWTSRPAPLRAGLRRIHREHGAERFPQPAEVQVAAAELEVEEKALILFRHARAARLPGSAIGLVQSHGWQIVEHPHFTPERIRRFVSDRLPDLAALGSPDRERKVREAVDLEIREPTHAMSASLAALGPEYRALLVALVDAPPGPVPERELAAAARRHSESGIPRPAGELVERLADHFVRVVPPMSVEWIHPSWRDLVIEALAADPDARRRFLGRCSLDGLLLALSVGGGAAGERVLPLLVDDLDWDTATDRLVELLPDLDDAEAFRLLAGLAGVWDAELDEHAHAELAALAAVALDMLQGAWRARGGPVPVSLLEAWLVIAVRLPDPPALPELAETWVELVPAAPLDLDAPQELARLDEWLTLAAVLSEHARPALAPFGFPAAQLELLERLVRASEERTAADPPFASRDLLARSLRRLAALDVLPQDLAWKARIAAAGLAPPDAPGPGEARRREAEEWRAAPPERSIVARVLSDLVPGAAE